MMTDRAPRVTKLEQSEWIWEIQQGNGFLNASPKLFVLCGISKNCRDARVAVDDPARRRSLFVRLIVFSK